MSSFVLAGFDGDDAEVAELEEQEALAIQKRLAAELDDNDFTLDVFTKVSCFYSVIGV